MGTVRALSGSAAAVLAACLGLSACSGTSAESRPASGAEPRPSADVWSLAVGQKAVVAFPEEDYGGWILWSQTIAEDSVAVLVECPADTSGFRYDDPRGGACVEAVGPGTAMLVWTDPSGIDAYVSTIEVAE